MLLSNRISTVSETGRLKAAGREGDHAFDLFPRHVVLFGDFVDTRTVFETFDDKLDGRAAVPEDHARLTLPGMLSTSWHWDQSRAEPGESASARDGCYGCRDAA